MLRVQCDTMFVFGHISHTTVSITRASTCTGPVYPCFGLKKLPNSIVARVAKTCCYAVSMSRDEIRVYDPLIYCIVIVNKVET